MSCPPLLREALGSMQPVYGGGDMASDVTVSGFTAAPLPER